MTTQPPRSYTRLAIAIVIAAALISASILYATSTSTMVTRTETAVSTTTLTVTPTTSSTTAKSLLGTSGELVIQGVGPFNYLHRNGSTPNQFTFMNVKFTLWTNTTVTSTGGPCYVNAYGGYVATFPDGSSETFTACLSGAYPYTQMLFTKHMNPQAGLLISGQNGDIYFLVSA
jgi:hypothetical protein